jgi:hypothetical protein
MSYFKNLKPVGSTPIETLKPRNVIQPMNKELIVYTTHRPIEHTPSEIERLAHNPHPDQFGVKTRYMMDREPRK